MEIKAEVMFYLYFFFPLTAEQSVCWSVITLSGSVLSHTEPTSSHRQGFK